MTLAGVLRLGRRPQGRRAPPVGPLLLTLLALAVVALPYLGRGPLWFSLSVLVLLVWRAYIALRGERQPPLLILFALAVLVGWGLSLTNGTLLGRDGGTPLLVLLTTLKALETHTRRDGRLLVLLGFFALSANFFFSQDTTAFLHAALASLLLMAALIGWNRPETYPSAADLGRRLTQPIQLRSPETWLGTLLPRVTLRQSGVLLMQALPLAAALFVLFPRPDGPLWQMPVTGGNVGASTGLSDEVTPGSVSSLAQSDAVALRAQFAGAVPPPASLYWRGPVLEAFDGRSWRRGPRNEALPTDLRGGQAPVSYTLTVEPGAGRWVTPLDLPVTRPQGTGLDGNLVLTGSEPIATRARFALRSLPGATWGHTPPEGQLAYDTQLPPGGNPRARELAASWQHLAPPDRVQAALKLLGSGQYGYTLNPPLLPGKDAVDDLLFSTKLGFCEHYAGAFAFLMRAAGVPARLVTGYLGGQMNGDYLIIRQADAHAWTEVWLADRGWTRVDPTAVVAPARVQDGLAAALPAAELPALLRGGNWLGALALRLDRLQNLWNQWVIGYDGARQRDLLQHLGLGAVGGLKYVLAFGAVLLVAALPLTLVLRRARALPPDPVQRAFLGLAAKLRLPRQVSEPASAWAKRAAQAYPQHTDLIDALTEDYQRLRYGQTPDGASVRAFARRVRGLRLRG